MTSLTALRETDDGYLQMQRMVFDYWACWTLRAVADLSIADQLAEGGVTAAELAAREGSAPDTTLRLMRAAVSAGLVTEQADGRFGSTSLSATLRSDDPQ